MGKISLTILGAIIGGFASAACLVWFFSWSGAAFAGPVPTAPSRADYVDLLLTLVSILLTAIGLAVTVGALVIGLVALKTLREIKDEASAGAKVAAATKVAETIDQQLGPSVAAKLEAELPSALQTALVEHDLGHKILGDMAQRGELDEIIERVANRMQNGGPDREEDDHDEDEI